MDKAVKVGAVIDSAKVFDIYREATGKLPERIPEGKNTLYTPFEVDGQAALLIQQRGFELLPGEKPDDANGLLCYIAIDAPDIETGRAAIIRAMDIVNGGTAWRD